MRRLMSALSLMVMFVIMATTSSFSASWEHLGTRKVNLGKDRDVVNIGPRKGPYRNLQLRVRGNDIFFKKMIIVFGNGTKQVLKLNQRVREGTVSAPINLRGDLRYIRRIVFDYKRIANFRGRAFVSVYGREHGAFVNPRKWKFLGKKRVRLLRLDKDTIRVGRSKGRFRRLQIRVSGNDIYFRNMTVVFGNGSTQDIQIRQKVREGTVSRSIDLRGRARFIDRIVLRYKRKLKTVFRGKAHVSVYGK